MELSSHEPEIPIPLNSSYGGGHGHMIHHDHHHHHHHPSSTTHNHIISSPPPQLPSSNNNNGSTNSSIPAALEVVDQHHHVPFKKMVRYRECLKNHAASMGGNVTDGCGEFMPSGEEGSIEALTCSACNCHRNFHRKEIEGEPQNSNSCTNYHHMVRKVILGGHHKNTILAPEAIGSIVPSRASGPPHHHQMIMSYNMGSIPSESDEQEDGIGGGVRAPHQIMKKRYRTKFTQEQKEKMLNFAEKVGWKIQKQEEAVVQQFCQEIGVKRRVLKVWMHNNKHNLAKKSSSTPPPPLPSSINNINTPTTTTTAA